MRREADEARVIAATNLTSAREELVLARDAGRRSQEDAQAAVQQLAVAQSDARGAAEAGRLGAERLRELESGRRTAPCFRA